MHQNILASTIVLGHDSDIGLDELPDQMQALVTELNTNKSLSLIGITHKYPDVIMEYNIPLDNHSEKLTINYNTKSHLFTIHWGFFGRNWDKRMEVIAEIAAYEGLIMNANLPFTPSYDEKSRVLRVYLAASE